MIQAFERPLGIVAVQQDDVAPILLRHVAIRRNEAGNSAVVAVRYHATFHAGVIAEAIPKAKAIFRSQRSFRRFHAQDRFGIHQLCISGLPAPQKKLHEFGQFARRSFQVLRRPQIDERISREFWRIAFIGSREQGSVCVSEGIIGVFHPHRTQERFTNVLIERLSHDLFDQVARNRIPRIGIGHPSSRRPASRLRILESLEHAEQWKVVAITQVVNFARLHVVESRGVLEEMHDSNGMHCLPIVLERNFRRGILQPRIKVDSSFFL